MGGTRPTTSASFSRCSTSATRRGRAAWHTRTRSHTVESSATRSPGGRVDTSSHSSATLPRSDARSASSRATCSGDARTRWSASRRTGTRRRRRAGLGTVAAASAASAASAWNCCCSCAASWASESPGGAGSAAAPPGTTMGAMASRSCAGNSVPTATRPVYSPLMFRRLWSAWNASAARVGGRCGMRGGARGSTVPSLDHEQQLLAHKSAERLLACGPSA